MSSARIARPNLAQIVTAHGTEGMFPSRRAYMDHSWSNLMSVELLDEMFKSVFGGLTFYHHARYDSSYVVTVPERVSDFEPMEHEMDSDLQPDPNE